MPEPAAPRPVRRGWTRVTATILAMGALAAAIGAILGLRSDILDLRSIPKPPDPRDVAHISIETDSPVTLSEGKVRMSAMLSLGAGSGGRQDRPAPARRLQPDPSSQADPTSDTSAPEPEPSSSSSDTVPEPSSSSSDATTSSSGLPSSTPSTTGQPTSSGLGTASSMELDRPAWLGLKAFYAYVDQVMERVRERNQSNSGLDECAKDPSCLKLLAVLVLNDATGSGGQSVEPEDAAKRLVELFRDTRTSSEGPGASEPLGVFVTADLRLTGLRGREVKLSWLMIGGGKGGDKRLHGNWLNDNVVYSLKAESDDDTGVAAIWIPLPRSAGPFRVQVLLKVDGVLVAHKTSKRFS